MKFNNLNELIAALKSNNFQQLENIFFQNMKQKLAEGWKIQELITYDFKNKECCAIGSLIYDHEFKEGLLSVVMNLGLEIKDYIPSLRSKLESIAAGFDNDINAISDLNYYSLGQKLFKQIRNFQNEI